MISTFNRTLVFLALISIETFAGTILPIPPEQGTLAGKHEIISPNEVYKLEGYFTCHYKLTNTSTSEVIVDEVGPDTYRNCLNFMGFSHDSSMFYVYDENSLYIYVFDVQGNLIAHQKVATDPYIESAVFSGDSSSITVNTSHDGKIVIELRK